MRAARVLLTELIDYAGVFPPASLELREAVRRYASDRRGPHAWMIGRFVVPAGRLEELAEAARGLWPVGPGAAPWRVSALVGPDLAQDTCRIQAFNAQHAARSQGLARVDVVEGKPDAPEAVTAFAEAFDGFERYAELPGDGDVERWLAAIRDAGVFAKVRTGGTVAEAIPSSAAVARFIAAANAAGVAWKATAGLHRALRADRPLTYAADSPRAVMHGFMNVFAASALALAGVSATTLEEVLEEREASAFEWTADGLRWRSHEVGIDTLSRSRRERARSFGSCSFDEPVADLQTLGWLPRVSEAGLGTAFDVAGN